MKTILITGASAGVGRALSVQAARAGYAVYAVGRNVSELATLAGQVGEEGGAIATDATDISEPAAAPGLIGRAVGTFGRIDILVNNAGAAASGPIVMQTDEEMRVQFGTHVLGPLALTREALPALGAASGHVFMVGSGVARVPVGGMGVYPPSKAALRSATSILRREVAALGIAVTYVDPGAVDTAFMTRAGMTGARRDSLVSPELVARKILLAIMTRPRVLNVTPLQTAAVALAELFPAVTEAVLERNPALVGAGPTVAVVEPLRERDGRGEKIALPIVPAPLPLTTDPPSPFDAALAPLQHRMERAKLTVAFVRALLVPGEIIDVGEAAMRWAGMPNKHERALTNEVLFALGEARFLVPHADGRYGVLYSADDTTPNTTA